MYQWIRLIGACSFFCALSLTFAFCHAQVFRCSGEAGVVFSDRPCSGSKQETLDMRYKSDRREASVAPLPAANTPANTAASAPDLKASIPPVTAPPSAASEPVSAASLEDRLAALCVDAYRGHLAYPRGVRIISKTLERRLDEMIMTVLVRTITNDSTPAIIETITLTEKFICVTDGGQGLNARSTGMYVNRHKSGQRL